MCDSFLGEGAGRGFTTAFNSEETPPCHITPNRPPPLGGNYTDIQIFLNIILHCQPSLFSPLLHAR